MECKKRMKKVFIIAIIMVNVLGGLLSKGPIEILKAEEATAVYKKAEATAIDGVVKVGNGTATIMVKGNEGQTLKGKKFHLYKLLCAENAIGGESVNYTINHEYEHALKVVVADELTRKGQTITAEKTTEYMILDYIKSMDVSPVEGANTVQNPQGRCSEYRFFVEALRNQIVREKIEPQMINVTTVKQDNTFEITGIDYGYYILDEVSNVAGTDSAAALCMVGTANPNIAIHVKSDYPSVVKKIKEDDKFSEPKITDVEGWNDIADFETGQNVPYKFVSNIPNINGYKTYYYAWHDKMDPKLTLCEDSIQISIQENDSHNNKKIYTLSKEEFMVDKSPENGNSFKITIPDVKKIIDREFQRFDDNKENQYGQKVVVTYNAVINEKVVDAVGNPAIENDVRLEFSNDPDSKNTSSTGYTPWDTVVCYTYKLNIKKTNDKNKVLENASFRLYSNQECTNEVYVKQVNDGYMIINRDQLGGKDHIGGIKPENAVEMKSNKDGSIMIYGIDSGTYFIKETKAPAGYRILKDPVVIKIKSVFADVRDSYVKGDGVAGKTLKNLEGQAKIKSFYNGNFKVEDTTLKSDILTGKINLTVVNQVGIKLPVTGNSETLIMVIGGMGLMILAILKKRKKDEK